MENKINVAELLKDCPQGMELDCTVYNNVTLEYVYEPNSFPICVRVQDRGTIFLSKYGQFHDESYCKCIIFPKGKTTWEGFVPPCKFKDGDIITVIDENDTFILHCDNGEFYDIHCSLMNGTLYIYKSKNNWVHKSREFRYATEEEKQKLFDAIKAKGYKWNEETKTLEKLPKFKVGDRVKKKDSNEDIVLITDIADNYYIVETKYGMEVTISMSIQNNYELVPDKFDINTLKPFDKVLVRDFDNTPWEIDFFSRLLDGKHFKCVDLFYVQCIPYEENKHLLGTTNDCDEYFKNW